jgi:CubicO group peptidase (beta-lactamase class C family)
MRVLALTTALLVSASAASLTVERPENVGLSSERLARIHTTLQRYIDRQEIAGAVSLVARHGRIAWFDSQGLIDLDSTKPMPKDAMFRIASMTKPLTSVAVMMLYEQGYFQLNDPVSKWIPEFKHMQVAVSTGASYKAVPAEREITIRHLLTHTSGLSSPYVSPGFLVPEYNKLVASRTPDETVGDFTKRLAKLPLEFQPGTAWAYGPSTDVLGYLVEVISGMPLDRFFEEKIHKPLGMTDTYFFPPDEKRPRLATVYTPTKPSGIGAMPVNVRGTKFFSGAGGLVSTAPDYARFCQMLLNGGQLEGTRLLSRKTIELMTSNHIGPLKLWDSLPGYRFGLGFRVLTDLGESANLGSVGSYGWGGAFGTLFWIDPKEDMFGILMIQLRPYDHINIRQDFQTMATQAIVE